MTTVLDNAEMLCDRTRSLGSGAVGLRGSTDATTRMG